MATVRAIPIIALWLLGMWASPAVSATGDDPQTLEIVERRCQFCHGRTGLSATTQFPKLAGQNVEYLTKQMFNFQSGARRSVVMGEQIAGLSGNEIEALAEYFSRQRMIPEKTGGGNQLARGRNLFFSGNPKTGVAACVGCHGERARGGQMLPRLAGQHAAYIERQLEAFIDRSRSNDRHKMHLVARNLTTAEIRAVAYFLSGLE